MIPEQFYGVAGKAKIKRAKKKISASKSESQTLAPSAGTASPQKPISKPASSGKKWMLIPALALLFLVGLAVGTWFLLKPPAKKTAEPQPADSIQPPPRQPSVTEEKQDMPEPEESAPSGEPVSESSTGTESVEPASESKPLPSDDVDGDGLTVAEEALFGTSDESNDSDNDGFLDLLEVVNLYNPAGFTPTRLVDAGLVKTYVSGVRPGYEVLYPNIWTVNEEDGGAVTFTDGEGESVVISIVSNQEGQSLLDWFINENPLVPTTRIEEPATKSGEPFLTVSDGTVSYILGDGVIYAISLEGEAGTLKFYATYRMMVNSFALAP